jgi:hypothetical protein
MCFTNATTLALKCSGPSPNAAGRAGEPRLAVGRRAGGVLGGGARDQDRDSHPQGSGSCRLLNWGRRGRAAGRRKPTEPQPTRHAPRTPAPPERAQATVAAGALAVALAHLLHR